MPSPAKKRPISDFFQPYIKSTVPAKRPSPSSEQPSQRKGPVRNVSPTRTPKTVRSRDHGHERTPNGPTFSPLSTPGSRASLPIRSPHPKSELQPASTYKQAPRFGTGKKHDPTPQRSAHSFSFADLPASTQSVVKIGEVIEIPDSDEDTDSLVSLDDILGRRKEEPATSRSSSPDVDEDKNEAERIKTLSLFTRGRSDPLVGKEKLRELYAKQKAQKYDMRGLLGDHFDDQETEEKIKKARDHYNESAKPRTQDRTWELNRKLLADIATTDNGEDGVSRLLNAVQRQEALTSDRTFSFFGAKGLNDWSDAAPAEYDFPESGIPNNLWRSGDEESRSRAFSSGYMTDLVARGQIPTEALTWTFLNIVLELEDEVRKQYIECLSQGSASWTRTNLSAQDVQSLFQTLGAESASLQGSVAISPTHYHIKEPPRRDPKYLLTVLDLFRAICQDMDFAALSKLSSVVCRLAIDRELMTDARVSCKVESLIEVLLSLPDHDTRHHVAERILADVGRHLKDPSLQAQLLSHILPTSSTASHIRIILAQAFLLGVDALDLTAYNPPRINLDLLTKHISTSPSFNTTRHKNSDPLDYVSLRFLSQILDVAISDGGRPSTPFSSRAEETAFNKSVDRLADAVRATFVSIVDTGASHMSRTEAKDVLQTIHWRLLYAVRTEVRPKKNIFDPKTGKNRDGDEVRGEQRERDFLKNFLGPKKDREGKKQENFEGPVQDRNDKTKDGAEAEIDGEIETLGNNESVKSVSSTVSSGTSTILSDSSERSETEQAIRRQLGLS